MAHHDDVLITGVLVVRAWGTERFNQTMKDAAKAIVAAIKAMVKR